MGQETSSHGNVKFLIDETVALQGDDRAYHVWDLEMDPSKEDKYALKAISRDGTPIRSYLLPQEELSHFTAGEEVWWEHRGEPGVKLDESFTVSERDPKPFIHHGDYALVLVAEPQGKTEGEGCDPTKVTLKFRERKET